ncbi:MAG: LytR/AlgR family response regulator transcription factor [Sedimentibacter sp.]
MIYNIAVCDDSEEYAEIVTKMIREIMLKNNMNCNISTFISSKKLIQTFKELNFDIVFLDMEMPEINGIETGLLIREISDKVVIFYLTSHKEYAYDSYKVKARDYLLKPVNFSQLEYNLHDCTRAIKESITYLDVKDVNNIMHRIPIDEITHILRKKEDRKLHIYTLDKREIIIVQTLENIEKEVSGYEYIARSSKSCIVNMLNIRTIIKNAIYFSNEAIEYASRRCLSELIYKFNIKRSKA